jgi:hypothetical protein
MDCALGSTGRRFLIWMSFFLKGIKNKIGKGVPVGNILKNRYLPPDHPAWGRGPPAHPAGGRFPKGLFANKKFREEVPAGASRPSKGRDEAEVLCPLPTDTARTRKRSGSAVNSFSKWIENEPKEKWALIYDTDGARYGIMTTNFAEVMLQMMLAPVLLKLALQVMLQMKDFRLHQGVGDVADRVLVRHQASFSCNFI